ncbi:MobA/MobL family protein [Azorhizobium sp. AG788]|uniref:MobA/MobL family protein n=1 Tax=Azorhizobium sp. AG788 TaxID=2183897 RepID=UPI003139A890
MVAMAACRAGERLHDSRRKEWSDFSGRRGVAHREIMAPEGSAPWLSDRQTLWNAVEHAEKRVDAQLAREINMALPHELTDDQRLDLVRGFVAEQFVARGMVADIAITGRCWRRGTIPATTMRIFC